MLSEFCAKVPGKGSQPNSRLEDTVAVWSCDKKMPVFFEMMCFDAMFSACPCSHVVLLLDLHASLAAGWVVTRSKMCEAATRPQEYAVVVLIFGNHH